MRRPPVRATASAFAITAGVALASMFGMSGLGCQNNDPLACVTVDLECLPLYPPTYDQAFANTFSKKCSTGGTACHSREGQKGGLVLEDKANAYVLLTDAHNRVIPGDPSCSIMVERLFSKNPNLKMPPGKDYLPDAERCALVQWIDQGALESPPDANLPDAHTDADLPDADLPDADLPDAGVDAP